MKKERQIKSNIDATLGSLTVNVEGKEDIIIKITDLTPELQQHALLHGLKQKVVDSAALGAGYTLTEKYEAMLETVTRITDTELPSWNKRSENGGVVKGLLFRALLRLYPDKDSQTIKDYHDKLDKSQQHALRQNPKIATIIEDIKAESCKASSVNSDELLNELEGI